MKPLLKKAAAVLALACASVTLQAQTPSVVYGRTTLQLSSGFVNSLQGLGAVITDLDSNPLQNNAVTFQATGGAIDLQTSAGQIEHRGGLMVNAGGVIIRIQNLTIDTSNPAVPAVTAIFVVNGHFNGRLALFNIQPPAGFTLPFQLQAGILQQNGLILTLASATVAELNGIFGGPAVQTGAGIGTANAYLVFSPVN